MLAFKIDRYMYKPAPLQGDIPSTLEIAGKSLNDDSVIEITIYNPTKDQIQEVMEAYDSRYDSLSVNASLIGNFSNERS